MASPAYEQILEIQALDLRLAQLRHRHATHPARAEVDAATAAVTEVDANLAEIAERHHELERTQKRLGDEVETIEAKRQEIDAKLYGGAITASKDLLVLQDEAASLLDRQRRFEDEQLEVMEQVEDVAGELDGARTQLQDATGDRDRAQAVLAEATGELDREIADVEQE